jgi:hypothetical protein
MGIDPRKRYIVAGMVNPGAEVTLDANLVVRRWITLRPSR